MMRLPAFRHRHWSRRRGRIDSVLLSWHFHVKYQRFGLKNSNFTHNTMLKPQTQNPHTGLFRPKQLPKANAFWQRILGLSGASGKKWLVSLCGIHKSSDVVTPKFEALIQLKKPTKLYINRLGILLITIMGQKVFNNVFTVLPNVQTSAKI